jgi:hypothetical protein
VLRNVPSRGTNVLQSALLYPFPTPYILVLSFPSFLLIYKSRSTSHTFSTTFPLLFIIFTLLQVTLSANILEPFSAEFIQHRTVSRTDDLALSFALAMMDFVEWDLLREAARRVNSTQSSSSSSSFSSVTVSSTLQYLKEAMKWYDYPPFIIQMLLHPPTWAAWRWDCTSFFPMISLISFSFFFPFIASISFLFVARPSHACYFASSRIHSFAMHINHIILYTSSSSSLSPCSSSSTSTF